MFGFTLIAVAAFAAGGLYLDGYPRDPSTAELAGTCGAFAYGLGALLRGFKGRE